MKPLDNSTTQVRFDESVRFDVSVRPDETRLRVPVMSSTCLQEGVGVMYSHSLNLTDLGSCTIVRQLRQDLLLYHNRWTLNVTRFVTSTPL